MSDPFAHVSDSSHWHIFENIDVGFHLPLGLTKFMVLEVIAAAIIVAIYLPLARRIATGEPPKGAWWNFWEVLLTFIRNEVARPNITEPHAHGEHGHGHHGHGHHGHGHHGHGHHGHGHHGHGHHGHGHHGHEANGHLEAAPGGAAAAAAAAPRALFCDRYVPFLWTMFLFILINNLLGMFPFMGSATGSFTVTVVLAGITFLFMHGNAIRLNGLDGYLQYYLPPIDAPFALKVVLVPMMFLIEVGGALIKCFVLAVRLFANMFAGHMVLASILLFIVAVKDSMLFYVVTPASVAGVVALSLLELFVAFLQAFIFTYLTAIFLGSMLAPEH
jgi:F-type H+-transporting ATPase subunit a